MNIWSKWDWNAIVNVKSTFHSWFLKIFIPLWFVYFNRRHITSCWLFIYHQHTGYIWIQKLTNWGRDKTTEIFRTIFWLSAKQANMPFINQHLTLVSDGWHKCLCFTWPQWVNELSWYTKSLYMMGPELQGLNSNSNQLDKFRMPTYPRRIKTITFETHSHVFDRLCQIWKDSI